MGRLLENRFIPYILVFVRLLALGILLFGSWLDEPDALSGWDVERFSTIAEANGQLWSEAEPVEYPPGSVVAIKAVVVENNLVASHRILAISSFVIDLLIAYLLFRGFSRKTSTAYLLVGLALIPMGYLRLDLWAAIFTVIASVILLHVLRTKQNKGAFNNWGLPLLFGLAVSVGAFIKIWPGVVLIAAFGLKKWRLFVAGLAWNLSLLTVWLLYSGNGIEPINQVVSLRGAKGWHVESVVGNAISVFSDSNAQLQMNAYRIGEIGEPTVLILRTLLIFVVLSITLFLMLEKNIDIEIILSFAVINLLTSLLITSSLLSPQFFLWMTPWLAILISNDRVLQDTKYVLVKVSSIAIIISIVLTGFTLAIFAPPELDKTIPSLMLLVRNLILAGSLLTGIIYFIKRLIPTKTDPITH